MLLAFLSAFSQPQCLCRRVCHRPLNDPRRAHVPKLKHGVDEARDRLQASCGTKRCPAYLWALSAYITWCPGSGEVGTVDFRCSFMKTHSRRNTTWLAPLQTSNVSSSSAMVMEAHLVLSLPSLLANPSVLFQGRGRTSSRATNMPIPPTWRGSRVPSAPWPSSRTKTVRRRKSSRSSTISRVLGPASGTSSEVVRLLAPLSSLFLRLFSGWQSPPWFHGAVSSRLTQG
jgi:hypothetical protein